MTTKIATIIRYVLVIASVTVKSSVTFADLSWNALPNTTIDEYFYEIGLSIANADQDCSRVHPNIIPQPYTNTSNSTAVVTSLEDNTCYVFGIRVYSTRTGQPGNWTFSINSTLAKGMIEIVVIYVLLPIKFDFL